MNRFTNVLGRVRVAAPCEEDWNEMRGDERVRFCARCSLNVYNLSAMTRREAERLVVSNEGRLCVRFYRRGDGTILTQNCPAGLARLRLRVSRAASAAAAAAVGLFAGVASAPDAKQSPPPDAAVILVTPPRPEGVAAPSCVVGVPVDEIDRIRTTGVAEEFWLESGGMAPDPAGFFLSAFTPLALLTALFTFLTWPLFFLSGENDEGGRVGCFLFGGTAWCRPRANWRRPPEGTPVGPDPAAGAGPPVPVGV